MSKKKKASPFGAELFRAALVLALSAALGMAVNALSSRGVPIFSGNSAGSAAQTGGTDSGAPRHVSLDELMRAWNDQAQAVQVVDVRGEAEYDTGHVPHSIHAVFRDEAPFTRQQFDAALQGATLIAVMCDSDDCPKADRAADALVKLGYKNVRVLQGGWAKYKTSGYQIEEARP